MGLRGWAWRSSRDGLLLPTPIPIERYAGPVLLAQGARDTVWASEMTHRLTDPLRAQGREPELHWYEGRDHVV